MAQTYSIVRGAVPEGVDVTLMRMISNADGLMLVPGDVSSIQLNVYDATQPGGTTPVALYSASRSVASTMFSTAQFTGWTISGTGYNFRDMVPASAFDQQGGKAYRYEYALTLNAAGPAAATGVAMVAFLVSVAPMLSA